MFEFGNQGVRLMDADGGNDVVITFWTLVPPTWKGYISHFFCSLYIHPHLVVGIGPDLHS